MQVGSISWLAHQRAGAHAGVILLLPASELERLLGTITSEWPRLDHRGEVESQTPRAARHVIAVACRSLWVVLTYTFALFIYQPRYINIKTPHRTYASMSGGWNTIESDAASISTLTIHPLHDKSFKLIHRPLVRVSSHTSSNLSARRMSNLRS